MDGQSTFAGVNVQENVFEATDNHSNAAFRANTIPSNDTRIYHDSSDVTNAYATVHPHEPSEENENTSGQLYGDTRSPRVVEISIGDQNSEEGWVDNDIYAVSN